MELGRPWRRGDGVLRDAVEGGRPRAVHRVLRSSASARAGRRRRAQAQRLRPLLPPQLRPGDAPQRAAKIREAAVSHLPGHPRHRAFREDLRAATPAAEKAHGEHEAAHLRLRGGAKEAAGRRRDAPSTRSPFPRTVLPTYRSLGRSRSEPRRCPFTVYTLQCIQSAKFVRTVFFFIFLRVK